MAPPLTEVRDIQLQLTTHLSTQKGWKAELAWLVDLQRTVYPHKWSTVSYRSSAGQRKYAGRRPTFYHWATVTIPHPPSGRLPLISAGPAVTFTAAEHRCPLAGTKLYCLVTEAHRCEQLAQCCYAAFALSRIWTHDLLITSPKLYPLHNRCVVYDSCVQWYAHTRVSSSYVFAC